MQRLIFRLAEEKDIEQLYRWSMLPHVAEYWRGPALPEVFRNKYIELIGSDFAFPYVVSLDEEPIGYIQHFVANKTDTWTNQPSSTIGVDLFIGEKKHLHKGYGTEMVRKIAQMLFSNPAIKRLVIETISLNTPAIRCYEKVGFRKIKIVPRGKDKILLMELKRQEYFVHSQLFERKRIQQSLHSQISRAVFDAIHNSLMLGSKDGKPTQAQLVAAYKRLAANWKSIVPDDKRLILNFLIDLSKFSQEERRLLEECFNEDTMINGNMAIFSAPRKLGGIIELRIQVGISGKYNPQGIALMRDAPGVNNILEAAEKVQDDLVEQAKTQVVNVSVAVDEATSEVIKSTPRPN